MYSDSPPRTAPAARRATTCLLGLAVFVLLAAVAVGCSPSPSANSVTIKGLAFQPQTITVSAGTTVKWTNQDQTAHSSTSDSWKEGTTDPNAWNSGPLNPGESFEFTFKNPGTYKYSCMVHPYMHGTVIVQ
jgi:plastocyanin